MLLDNNLIILLSGPAGCGKDTSYEIIKKIYTEKGFNVRQYAFGKSLKEIVVDLSKLYLNANFSVEDMSNLAYKELPRPEYIIYRNNEAEHLVIRTLLQQIGTDIIRKNLGDDIFAQSVVKQIDRDFKKNSIRKPEIAVITDLRFPNELNCIENYCNINHYKFLMISINRHNYKIINNSHSSESYFNELKSNITIDNLGTLDDLETNIREVLE